MTIGSRSVYLRVDCKQVDDSIDSLQVDGPSIILAIGLAHEQICLSVGDMVHQPLMSSTDPTLQHNKIPLP